MPIHRSRPGTAEICCVPHAVPVGLRLWPTFPRRPSPDRRSIKWPRPCAEPSPGCSTAIRSASDPRRHRLCIKPNCQTQALSPGSISEREALTQCVSSWLLHRITGPTLGAHPPEQSVHSTPVSLRTSVRSFVSRKKNSTIAVGTGWSLHQSCIRRNDPSRYPATVTHLMTVSQSPSPDVSGADTLRWPARLPLTGDCNRAPPARTRLRGRCLAWRQGLTC
jgi:hypothetical protein